MKILVVDDDPASLLLLKAQLRKAGHGDVTTARDGQQAWEAFEKDAYAVVISDCMMPEMDGFTLCRRVRARASASPTYFILLTAHDGREELRKGMEAGADDFLGKPFDPDQLQARLRVAQRIVTLEREVARLSARAPE